MKIILHVVPYQIHDNWLDIKVISGSYCFLYLTKKYETHFDDLINDVLTKLKKIQY